MLPARTMYIDLETYLQTLRIANDPRTTTWRRVMCIDALMALVTSINVLNYFGERRDQRVYPEYENVPLGEPIFIVAAPRSGTTLLHRLMTQDAQFTSLTIFEAAFHSITARDVLEGVGRIPGPVRAGVDAIKAKLDSAFDGWQGLHDTGIDAEEEDESIWAIAYSSAALWFVVPSPDRLPQLASVDELPAEKRAGLRRNYQSALRRHLYRHPGRTLLGKNVLMPGRLKTVRESLPGARFVHIVRHPYEAIASAMSLFTLPWTYIAPEVPLDGPEAEILGDLFLRYYRQLHEASVESERAGDGCFYTLRYTDLIKDPAASIRDIYERFGLELTDEFAAAVQHELTQQHGFKSQHEYTLEQFGLTQDKVYRELRDVFEVYGFER